jgi:ribose transport system ATP-binding protein
VLDEPTASLPADEVGRLFVSLRRLRERGVAMIYVSHRLDEVFAIADRMVVLRDGRVVGDRRVANTTAEQAILLIVGREPSLVFRRAVEGHGRPRLVLEELRIDWVGPINAEIHAGEVVGLVGLRGAGQELVGRCVFGLEPATGGRIVLDGVPVAPRSPRAAMAAGIDLVWGDRTAGSVVPMLSVRENMYINPLAAGLKQFSYIAPGAESRAARELGGRVGLRPNDPAMPVEALSGGNQQKVVVGRWLHLRGKVYIFEDPTAGVDVGAKADIYKLFNVALQAGAAILIVSTDFEEVANVCHRALVFDRGRMVAELAAADLSINALLAAASASVALASAAPPLQG